MEWDDLRYVLATARSKSYIGASQRLKVSHTTVGRRVRALERDMGHALFKKTRDGMMPTEYCEKILSTAEAIEREVRNMTLATANTTQEPEGMVRIHTAHWVLEHILTPHLPALQSAHPKIRPYFVGDVVDSIDDFEVPSISLRAEGMAKKTDVEAHLTEVPYSVFCLKGRDPEDLKWASFSAGKMGAGQLAWMRQQGHDQEEINALGNDAALVCAMVATGAYKGLLPHLLARKSPELVRLTPGPPDLFRRFSMIVDRRALGLAEVTTLMDWIRSAFDHADLAGAL